MGDLTRHGFDFTKEGYEIELSEVMNPNGDKK
jgi:hypothetical protein